MKQLDIVKKVMSQFSGSFINSNNELILIPKSNVYFCLDNVNSEQDLKEKLCEYLSRSCCCTMPYRTEGLNKKHHIINCEKFNSVCGTDFTVDDMMIVYARLGNGINHQLAYEFVQSGFDLKILKHNRRT